METALTLPLLAFIMFASSQISHYVHVKTCLKIAGSEAAYAWGKAGGTMQDAQRVFTEQCDALGLKNCHLGIHADSADGCNNPNDVIGVIPRADLSSNQLPLPIQIYLPTSDGKWIECEDIYYRREAN